MNNTKQKFTDVYDYILTEETDFQTRKIPLAPNWQWNMKEHVDKSFQLKNSQFTKGDNTTYNRPFKNIIIPIVNVQYRSEGFDVKDVEVYVEDEDNYHLSLFARKFHSRWALKYSIDTAVDDSVESYVDYGLTLVKNVNEVRPEVVPLQMIAFCDQTDILSGPICLKHQYSISQLMDMKGKWDAKKIDQAILMSEFNKGEVNGSEVKTPGKYIEVYELHGAFPETWLNDEEGDNGKYVNQLHIVTYYVDAETGNKNGITLFKGKETKPFFKALKRDGIYGRACGRGGIEELYHPQIWTNFSEIHLQQMLEATSKVITKTNDKKLAQQNNLSNLKHGQIVYMDDGKDWGQMQIQPINKVAFDNYVNLWEQNARTLGSASDPQLGLNPVSGTPLGTTEIVTSQGQGIHEYRRGKIATFWGEIYRDWVLQYLADELNKGDKWVDELSLDELKEVADRVSINESNRRVKDIILSGKDITKEQQQALIDLIKDSFMKGGKQKFLKIMKKEFSDLPLAVKFNIAGKQKNLYEVVNKLNAVFRTIFANPAVLQQPGMDKLFNQILESSGLSPIDFSNLTKAQPQPQMPMMQGAVESPMQLPELQNNQQQA